mmetsp:Transcript_46391/g.130651  ORF Transcript_46391/g.130651 Transcript_46391/m.130651 type:complete len:87 (-) Transcript_46391:876-1136(-)
MKSRLEIALQNFLDILPERCSQILEIPAAIVLTLTRWRRKAIFSSSLLGTTNSGDESHILQIVRAVTLHSNALIENVSDRRTSHRK